MLDHELIVVSWSDLAKDLARQNNSRITGWNIQGFINNKDKLKVITLE